MIVNICGGKEWIIIPPPPTAKTNTKKKLTTPFCSGYHCHWIWHSPGQRFMLSPGLMFRVFRAWFSALHMKMNHCLFHLPLPFLRNTPWPMHLPQKTLCPDCAGSWCQLGTFLVGLLLSGAPLQMAYQHLVPPSLAVIGMGHLKLAFKDCSSGKWHSWPKSSIQTSWIEVCSV